MGFFRRVPDATQLSRGAEERPATREWAPTSGLASQGQQRLEA